MIRLLILSLFIATSTYANDKCFKDVARPPSIYLYGEAHDLTDAGNSLVETLSKGSEEEKAKLKKTLEDFLKDKGLDQSKAKYEELMKANFEGSVIYVYEGFSFSETDPIGEPFFNDRTEMKSAFALEPAEPKVLVALYAAMNALVAQNIELKKTEDREVQATIIAGAIHIFLTRFSFIDSPRTMAAISKHIPTDKNIFIPLKAGIDKFMAQQDGTSELIPMVAMLKNFGFEPAIEGMKAAIVELAEFYNKGDYEFPKGGVDALKAAVKNPLDQNANAKAMSLVGVEWRNRMMLKRIKDLYCQVALPRNRDLHVQVGAAHLDGLYSGLKKWTEPGMFSRRSVSIFSEDFISKKKVSAIPYVPSGSSYEGW